MCKGATAARRANSTPAAAEVIANVITGLETELSRADAACRKVVAGDPVLAEDYRLLTTIPAIGSQAATITMVELPGVDVLRSARQAVAYAALNLCQNQSGKTERATRIARIGKATCAAPFTCQRFAPCGSTPPFGACTGG